MDDTDDFDTARLARFRGERAAPLREHVIAIGLAVLVNVFAGALPLRAPALAPGVGVDMPIEVVWIARAPAAASASAAAPAVDVPAPATVTPDAQDEVAGPESAAAQADPPPAPAAATPPPSNAAPPATFRGGQIPADEDSVPVAEVTLRDDEKGRPVLAGPDALERGDFGRRALVVGATPEDPASLDDAGRSGQQGDARRESPADCATLRARLRDGDGDGDGDDGDRERIVRTLVALGCG